MRREQIEAKINDRLRAVTPLTVMVGLTPENPAQWSKVGPKGAMYTRYMGSVRVESPVNVPNPRRRMRFHVYVGVKNVRSKGEAHLGAQVLLDYADAALGGYVIDDDRDNRLWLIPVGDEFYQLISGVWWYYAEFTTPAYQLTLPEIP